MHAVEIGDHGIDVEIRRRGIQDRCEGVGQYQVLLIVDLDGSELRYRDGRRTTEEAVLTGPKAYD